MDYKEEFMSNIHTKEVLICFSFELVIYYQPINYPNMCHLISNIALFSCFQEVCDLVPGLRIQSFQKAREKQKS